MICRCHCPDCGRVMSQAMNCHGDHVMGMYIISEYYSCRCGRFWKKEIAYNAVGSEMNEVKTTITSMTPKESETKIDTLIAPVNTVFFQEVV